MRTAAAIAAAGLLLGGCSLWSDDGAPTPKSTPKDLPTTAWTRSDDVADGGTLRLAVAALPATFNPAQASGADSAELLAPTTGSPVRIQADGSWKVDPDYARSVKVVDGSPLTVEVALNPKAVWQGGTPVTSADMVAYWHALAGDVKGLEIASTDGWDDIASVEPDGDFAYTVVFDEVRSDWPQYVYPRLAQNVAKSRKLFNTGFVDRAVSSNGPFMATSVDRASGTITLERNPRWWGRTPKLTSVIWRVAVPKVQAEAFALDELDAVEATPETYADLADEGVVQRASGRTWTQVTFSSSTGPLADVAVRRAIAQALPREAMAEEIADVFEAPARTQDSLVLVPGQPGYRTAEAAVFDHDLAGAKKLLAPKKLTLRMPVPAGVPQAAERAASITKALAKVGVTVQTTQVPADRFYADVLVPLDFDLVSFPWSGGPFPVQAAERRFRPIDSPENFTGVAPKSLDAPWRAASRALDAKARAKAVQAIDDSLIDGAIIVPIAVVPEVQVVREGLLNFGATTFEQPDWTIVGFAPKKKD